MVARIKKILQCIICLEIVGCPAVQCKAGHLMCGRCIPRYILRDNTCPTCRQPLIAVRNLAVEQVAEVLPKECPYAESCCQELLDADEMDTHRVTCPFRQFSCPHPSCSWTGYKPEIISHLRDRHPQHVLSSNKQAVQVPVVWNEVSSWTIFFRDEILLLKFRLEQATNMLFGSFKCLGSLIPVNSLMYYITVKRGDHETNVSGSIGPERSATTVQCYDDWDIVFLRNRFDVHTASESHSSDFIIVDVEVKDNRREGAGQEDGEVVEQAQQCEVRDEGGAPTTGQDGCNKQSDQIADRVIQELGDWICLSNSATKCSSIQINIRRITSIITETRSNIIKVIQKSIDDIAYLDITDWVHTGICITNLYLRFSRDFAEKQIRSERLITARGWSERWIEDYFRILSFTVSEGYYENMLELYSSPNIDKRELDELVTAREGQFRNESAQRMLRWAHWTGGSDDVKKLIRVIGKYYCKKSEDEIDRLTNDTNKISWSDITLPNSSTL